MKIDTSAKSPASSGVKESTARGSKQGASAIDTASAAKKPASQDSVQITSLSTQLQAMENVPVIDHARVEAIKLAISEGKFSVNAGAIADSLLASVKDLVQNQKA
ncbi:MAG: flagellar biosynthesis anti-sigma factor FlgM [Betaproteobacteria bacterium]|nr:flagellar biosynthesis anti-sigma factor FlgM [Betaproteobacteria bacterium]